MTISPVKRVIQTAFALLYFSAASLFCSATASAGDFVFDLSAFTGDPVYVQVTITDNGTGTFHFNVEQTNSTYNGAPTDQADLRGLFFHVNEANIAPEDLVFTNFSAWGYGNPTPNLGLSLAPTNIYTGNVGVYNEVGMAGQQNVINPKKFDIGLEFGTSGASPDLIQGVSFDVTTSLIGGTGLPSFLPFNMEHFIGARVTSTDGPDGSSKLSGCCGTTTTVPEPSSMAGILALALGGLLWRRRQIT